MWIRSQDEEILVNLDGITAIKYYKLYENPENCGPMHMIAAIYGHEGQCSHIELGCYHSGKRIMEVLDEIEDEIMDDNVMVYCMPDE